MKLNKNNTKQIGVLLLEVLMVVLVFTYSWTNVKARDTQTHGGLSINAASAERVVFRNSHSSSESLLEVISKIQFSVVDFGSFLVDVPSMELATCEAFLITPALYNTFYTYTTIKAP